MKLSTQLIHNYNTQISDTNFIIHLGDDALDKSFSHWVGFTVYLIKNYCIFLDEQKINKLIKSIPYSTTVNLMFFFVWRTRKPYFVGILLALYSQKVEFQHHSFDASIYLWALFFHRMNIWSANIHMCVLCIR